MAADVSVPFHGTKGIKDKLAPMIEETGADELVAAAVWDHKARVRSSNCWRKDG